VCGATLLAGSAQAAPTEEILFSRYPSSIFGAPGRIFADDFRIPYDADVTKIRWWGSYTTSPFTLELYEKVGNGPASTPKYSLNPVNALRTSYGPYTQYETPVIPNWALRGNETYYLSILNGNFLWEWAPDCLNNCSSSSWERKNGGWVLHGGGLSLQIIGVVPEPSGLVLAGLGLIGLLGIAWQRRRRGLCR